MGAGGGGGVGGADHTKWNAHNHRIIAKEMLSRLINKLSQPFWTVHVQKYPNSLFSSDISASDKLPSAGEISRQLALSYIPVTTWAFIQENNIVVGKRLS